MEGNMFIIFKLQAWVGSMGTLRAVRRAFSSLSDQEWLHLRSQIRFLRKQLKKIDFDSVNLVQEIIPTAARSMTVDQISMCLGLMTQIALEQNDCLLKERHKIQGRPYIKEWFHRRGYTVVYHHEGGQRIVLVNPTTIIMSASKVAQLLPINQFNICMSISEGLIKQGEDPSGLFEIIPSLLELLNPEDFLVILQLSDNLVEPHKISTFVPGKGIDEYYLDLHRELLILKEIAKSLTSDQFSAVIDFIANHWKLTIDHLLIIKEISPILSSNQFSTIIKFASRRKTSNIKRLNSIITITNTLMPEQFPVVLDYAGDNDWSTIDPFEALGYVIPVVVQDVSKIESLIANFTSLKDLIIRLERLEEIHRTNYLIRFDFDQLARQAIAIRKKGRDFSVVYHPEQGHWESYNYIPDSYSVSGGHDYTGRSEDWVVDRTEWIEVCEK
jgi:hypothetical protein